MDFKTKKLLESLNSKKTGIFYDDSNLYHAYQKYGWRIDLEKFRRFFERYCEVRFLNYYLVIPANNDAVVRGTRIFLEKIKPFATVRVKELKYMPVGGQVVKKGNMDVEIVLDVVRTIGELDVVMVVSGDSDFYELKNYVVNDKSKKIVFIGYEENMAWELRQCWHIYVNRIRDKVEFNKKAPSFTSG